MEKAAAFSLSSLLAGAVAGAVLGFVGGLLPLGLRVVFTSLLAIAAVVLGSLELLFGRRVPLPQIARATPQSWLEAGPLRWAVKNGAVLGIGATNRIGFWLWYAIPLGALLSGNPLLGGIVYGTYGLVRGLGPWPVILAQKATKADAQEWLIERHGLARGLAAAQLVLLGTAAAVVFGL